MGEQQLKKIKHSKIIQTSYGVGNVVPDLIGAVLAVILFAYYETEIGLSTILTGTAMIIFAIWDAVNDTIVGYISDRPYRFTEKWGRRFPWIVGIFIPMLLFFVLIFYPPLGANEWLLFTWLVVTVCIFDTFESIFVVNFFGLFPDKFRDPSERITASTIGTYFVILGTIIGSVFPTMIIVFGEINTYVLMAWIAVVTSLICFGLFIPGVKDDKENVKHYVKTYEKVEKDPFFKSLLTILKQRNFAAYLVLILGYFTMINTWGSSLLYYTRYVINAQASIASLFQAVMFVGAMIGVIIWFFYVRKTKDNRKVMIFGGLVIVIPAVLLSFIVNYIGITICMLIIGLGVGGFLVMMTPTFSDVIDESITKTKTRNEGLLGGLRFFVMNFSRVTMSIILMIVHIATGFIEGSGSQPPAAIIGVQLHTGLIPALFFLLGILIFWKFYNITPERALTIKKELLELDL
jgi:GPH family glycoside/pentoside/hexuronide:cation symporter